MTSSTNASSGKCSKPKGEYCRLHNPAPSSGASAPTPNFANMTPEKIFASLDKKPNLASGMIPPVLNPRLRELDGELREARTNLYDYAQSKGIDIPDIGYYTHGSDSEIDPKLKDLENTMHERMSEWDDLSENRELVMKSYMNKMLRAEFPDKYEQEAAKIAVCARFAADDVLGNEDEPSVIAEAGYTPQDFFKRVNEPNFSRRLENIEKAYIKTAHDGKIPSGLMASIREMRKRRETSGPNDYQKEEDFNISLRANRAS
jgi:hypothetical protein